jgi:hypothetical protein
MGYAKGNPAQVISAYYLDQKKYWKGNPLKNIGNNEKYYNEEQFTK